MRKLNGIAYFGNSMVACLSIKMMLRVQSRSRAVVNGGTQSASSLGGGSKTMALSTLSCTPYVTCRLKHPFSGKHHKSIPSLSR